MTEQPRATVVIVNWNGERLLRSCLDALARQQTSAPFLTWVVDNASSDGSVALLEREYPDVRVLRNDANLGFAGGNNTALRQVSTPYAVLLNNDATPEPDWLEQLLEPFAQPGDERLGAVTSKVVFQPRFLRLTLTTPGFSPGAQDPRKLGLRLHALCVEGVDVTERVLLERLTWGAEGEGANRFRWTRPHGELLVPLPDGHPGPFEISVRWAAESTKTATLSWDGGAADLPVTATPSESTFEVPAGVPAVDVVNNVGSIVTTSGYGADRGYQEVDAGQYDAREEVFALCGAAVAFRTEAGRAVDWFDDDFFLYYEDTDLSWRLRAAGWGIAYQPKAVVRHVHSASTVEWSPVWMFHTTRNRVLMLVKNASADQARREYAAFLAETLPLARPVIGALRRGRRPAAGALMFRLKVLVSLLRLTPSALRRRRAIRRSAEVPRREARAVAGRGQVRIRGVVVNYNGGEEVLGCLRSLLASDWPSADLEVVVVDNGSVDGSSARIEAELPDVRVVRSPGNLGYPAINQVVTDLSGIDAVAIVNPDTVVDPGCLRALADALAADPALGATCPRIVLAGKYRDVQVALDGPVRASIDLLDVEAGSWHLTGPRVRRRWHGGVAWSIGDGSILRTTAEHVALRVRAHRPGQLTLRSGDSEVSTLVARRPVRIDVAVGGPSFEVVQNAGSVIGPHGLGINRGYHQADGPAFDQAVDVPAWCGAAALLRSDYLRQVGLLDPRWFLYYEDTDLAWRGLRQGWRYRYVPQARVTHAHSTTIGHGSGLYDVQHVRNRLLTVAKNAPRDELIATSKEAVGLIGTQLRSDVVARVRDRRLPELTLTARRVKALTRAARLLPAVLSDARSLRRTATVADDALPVLGRWRDPTGAR